MEFRLNDKDKKLVYIFLICLLGGFLLLLPAVRQLVIGIAGKLFVRGKLNDYKWSSILMWLAIGDIIISGYVSIAYLFIDKITKKKILLLFFILMGIWLNGILYFSFSPASYVDFTEETTISLYPQAVSAISGYEVNGDRYLTINEDPQIYILPPKLKLTSTLIKFSEPVLVDTYVQVYYAVNNVGLAEENSVAKSLPKGSSEITIDLPSAVFTTLRYDINIFDETFEIKGIYVNGEELNHILVWAGNKNALLIVSIIILLVILWSLWSLGIMPVWIDRINKKIKNIEIAIQVRRHYKGHIFIFAALSFYFFLYLPVSFIDKFIAATICIAVLLNMRNLKFEYFQWHEKILFIIINAYLALAFFGYDLFLENSLKINSLEKFFTYCLSFIWTGYIFQSALNLMKYLSHHIKAVDASSNKNYWKKWFVLFAIMCSVFMVWQRAYNPVVLHSDSSGYLDGWLNGRYNNVRSPVYAFLVKIICSIAPTKPEVQWIVFSHTIAFSSLLATILMYFHIKVMQFKWLIPIAIMLPIIPSFGLFTLPIMTDLACGMAIMWFTYVLVRILDEVIIHDMASKRQQISFNIQLCISLVLCCFIRSNSFLVYLVMAPVLALLFLRCMKWKLLATNLITVILVLLINFVGFKTLNVKTDRPIWNAKEMKYYGLLNDIQGTYYDGGKFSQQTQKTLMKIMPKIDDPEVRKAFRTEENVLFKDYDLSELTIGKFVSMYTDSFMHNPFKMTKFILLRCKIFCLIYPKGRIFSINFTNIIPPNGPAITERLGLHRDENILTEKMNNYLKFMTKSIPATFVWRHGFWVALMMISIMTLILQKKFIWLLTYLPVYTYLASLFLAAPSADFRTGLPMFFVGMFLPLIFVLQERKTA